MSKTNKNLNKKNLIIFPSFCQKEDGTYTDITGVSNNGLDVNSICIDYAKSGSSHVGFDCDTIYVNGIFYQVYDVSLNDNSDISDHFVGGDTIILRQTRDFINFTEKIIPIDSKFRQQWAPQLYYENGIFHLFVSLSDCESTRVSTAGYVNWSKQIYVMHSSNNMETWSKPTRIELDLDCPIDPGIIKKDNRYYLFVKNELTGNIVEYVSANIESDYTFVTNIDTGSIVMEGPSPIYYKNLYYLYYDAIGIGNLSVFVSEDLIHWNNSCCVINNTSYMYKHCTPVVLSDENAVSVIQSLIDKKGNLYQNTPTYNENWVFSYIFDNVTYNKLVLYPNRYIQNTITSNTKKEFNDYTILLDTLLSKCYIANLSTDYNASIVLNRTNIVRNNLVLNGFLRGTIIELTRTANGVISKQNSITVRDSTSLIITLTFIDTRLEHTFNPPYSGYLQLSAVNSIDRTFNLTDLTLGCPIAMYSSSTDKDYYSIVVPVVKNHSYKISTSLTMSLRMI